MFRIQEICGAALGDSMPSKNDKWTIAGFITQIKARQPKDSYLLRIKIWIKHQADHPGQFSNGRVKGNSRMDSEARRS